MISTNQLFAGNEVKGKAVHSKKYADMSAAVSLNSNLLDFYSTYPKSMIGNSMLTCWVMYAKAPIDKKVSE
ncbi:MAG: hypothetical protein IJ513_07190 [Bacteroidaceae bacterium]|nr:hypothetical protein [Bacteroidaceae bacterium]